MPVADLGREVERLRDPERLLVVPEPPAEALLQREVESLLTGMAERRMTHVMAEADRLREILVQPQRPCDAARDRRCLQRVRHPRPVVIAGRIDEDLRLALQPAERLRVQDAVAVALERRPQPAFRLVVRAPGRLVGAHCERREPRLLVRANALLEGVRNPSGQLGHALPE